MKNSDTVYAVLPFIVIIALGTGFWFVFRERAAARREALERRMMESEPGAALRSRSGRRLWWANPWLWLGVSVASILLGIFVWPGLFGGDDRAPPRCGSPGRAAVRGWIRRPTGTASTATPERCRADGASAVRHPAPSGPAASALQGVIGEPADDGRRLALATPEVVVRPLEDLDAGVPEPGRERSQVLGGAVGVVLTGQQQGRPREEPESRRARGGAAG